MPKWDGELVLQMTLWLTFTGGTGIWRCVNGFRTCAHARRTCHAQPRVHMWPCMSGVARTARSKMTTPTVADAQAGEVQISRRLHVQNKLQMKKILSAVQSPPLGLKVDKRKAVQVFIAF